MSKYVSTIVLFVLVLSFLVKCQKEVPAGCSDALPPWLSTYILQLHNWGTKVRVTQYVYKSKVVFMVDTCPLCPDDLVTVYDCNGNVLCEFGGIVGFDTCPDFYQKAIYEKLITAN